MAQHGISTQTENFGTGEETHRHPPNTGQSPWGPVSPTHNPCMQKPVQPLRRTNRHSAPSLAGLRPKLSPRVHIRASSGAKAQENITRGSNLTVPTGRAHLQKGRKAPSSETVHLPASTVCWHELSRVVGDERFPDISRVGLSVTHRREKKIAAWDALLQKVR